VELLSALFTISCLFINEKIQLYIQKYSGLEESDSLDTLIHEIKRMTRLFGAFLVIINGTAFISLISGVMWAVNPDMDGGFHWDQAVIIFRQPLLAMILNLIGASISDNFSEILPKVTRARNNEDQFQKRILFAFYLESLENHHNHALNLFGFPLVRSLAVRSVYIVFSVIIVVLKYKAAVTIPD